jgi:hypothetical protein
METRTGEGMKHERRWRATRAGQTSEEGKERAREIVRVLE